MRCLPRDGARQRGRAGRRTTGSRRRAEGAAPARALDCRNGPGLRRARGARAGAGEPPLLRRRRCARSPSPLPSHARRAAGAEPPPPPPAPAPAPRPSPAVAVATPPPPPVAPPARPLLPAPTVPHPVPLRLRREVLKNVAALKEELARCPAEPVIRSPPSARAALVLEMVAEAGALRVVGSRLDAEGPVNERFVTCARSVLEGKRFPVTGSTSGDADAAVPPPGPDGERDLLPRARRR